MSTTNEQIKFKKGQLDNLPTAKDAGTLFFAQDNTHSKSGRLYLDVNNSTRVQVSGAGYDLSGQEVITYNDGTESASVIAGESAEIFNDYRARTNGSSDKTGNVATGEYSTASGLGTTAEGSAAFSVGSGTTASGEASFAGGKNSLVNGNFAAGFGENTQVSGDGSFGIGDGTRAIGDHSFAGGQSADYITLQVTKSLGNNQYQITNLNGDSNYLDGSNNLTDLGKLSIGSVVFQVNAENNGRGSIAIIENKEKNENDECIITLKNQDPTLLSWAFTTGPFQFVPGGSYGKNSFSFGENCTAAGENSISGGNGVNVWGSNAIGWGSAENWNLEGNKVDCQNKINEWSDKATQAYNDYEAAPQSSMEEIVQKAKYFMEYTNALQQKMNYESLLKKLNLYENYFGVGNSSAVFGVNNSSLANNSLVSGIFNNSQGDNSLVIGEGNVAYYPNMLVLGKFASSLYSIDGVLNYEYGTKKGTALHSKTSIYLKPQILVGNGSGDNGDSNGFEVYNNGLVRAFKSFRVSERGEINDFKDTASTGKVYAGLRVASFNAPLFLDSGSYVCPPPSKDGLITLGAPLAKWKNIETKKIETETLSVYSNYIDDDTVQEEFGVECPFHPKKTLTYGLGWNKRRWKNFFVGNGCMGNFDGITNNSGTNYLSFTIKAGKNIDSNLSGKYFDGSICLWADGGFVIPRGNNNTDFGHANVRWKTVYTNAIDASGNVTVKGKFTPSNANSSGTGGIAGNLYPAATNTYYIGNAQNIWKKVQSTDVSATTGHITTLTINSGKVSGVAITSDKRLKTLESSNILNLDLKIYDSLDPVCYKYKNVLPEDDFSRTHIGFFAQDVAKVIDDIGLTSEECALVWADPLEEDTPQELKDVCTDGYKYYLNYNEFHGLHMLKNHQQDDRLAALEEKNKELENTISELKIQIELFKLAIGG